MNKMRGRPRDPEALHYVVATRVSEDQYQYLWHVVAQSHVSLGTVLRKLIERARKDDLNLQK